MGRPVTLFTLQWSDLPLEVLAQKAAQWGYDGLELAWLGDHLNIERAAVDQAYCRQQRQILKKHGLELFSISNHLPGQLVCDLNNDTLSDVLAPAECKGNAEKKRQYGIQSMKNAARAAQNLGVKVVNGLTGSAIWHLVYTQIPVPAKVIEEGFAQFAVLWHPILDVFDKCGVRFGLEVNPNQIGFDLISTQRALDAIDRREAFGINFDPSHLHWQMVDPVCFLTELADRIYHVHIKDTAFQFNGRRGILGSHLKFGHPERGWDFRSPGRGQINFEEIIRALNQIKYLGPLSVEWEDSRMDREYGAQEACEFVKKIDFAPSCISFDAAFEK